MFDKAYFEQGMIFFFKRVNNIKRVMHLQRAETHLGWTHCSKSAFGSMQTRETITGVFVKKKKTKKQVQNKFKVNQQELKRCFVFTYNSFLITGEHLKTVTC